jgi:hypothetical protein
MMGDPALKRDMPDNDNDEVRIRKKGENFAETFKSSKRTKRE